MYNYLVGVFFIFAGLEKATRGMEIFTDSDQNFYILKLYDDSICIFLKTFVVAFQWP